MMYHIRRPRKYSNVVPENDQKRRSGAESINGRARSSTRNRKVRVTLAGPHRVEGEGK